MNEHNSTKSHDYIPSIELRKFVEVLLSEEVRGNKTEATKRSGVRKELFYYHFKFKPEFRQWYSERCTELLGSCEGLAAAKLITKIQSGELEAIKLYYELIGKLKKSGVIIQNTVNNKVGSNGSFTGEDGELTNRFMGILREKLQK